MKTDKLTILSNLFVALSVLVSIGCGGDGRTSGESPVPALPTIIIDNITLNIEIAQDENTRALGLMHRQSLPENQGMLFVFESTRILSFWMRNTFIPLDIAFIDENGKIVDIQTMAPLDETKQYVSAAPALYALEVNAGWFKRNSLSVGSTVTF